MTTYTPDPAASWRPVSAPGKPLPAGAWDTHAHVFGPFDAYPLLEPRRYNPPLAPAAHHREMLDATGFARGVLVHSSASGYDNSVTSDAVTGSGGRVLGVAVVQPDIADAVLADMDQRGFRGIRITVNGPRSQMFAGSLDFNDLHAFAPRLRALGWHAQIWAKCEYLVAEAARIASYGIPVVLDHMGYFEPEKGVRDAAFQSLLSVIRDQHWWVKLTPIRLTKTDPTYASIRPFHDALVERFPDRLLFGSDWPYISLDKQPPDPGKLVDLFDAWTPDADIRQKVFVDNPEAFYLRKAGTVSARRQAGPDQPR